MGLIKLMANDKNDPPSKHHKEIMDRLTVSIGGLLTMIDNLLDISRLRTGKITAVKRFIHYHWLIEKRTEQLKHVAEEKGITIVNQVPVEMRVYCDPDLMGQCISNLLSNAIKFTNKGGKVVISSPEGHYATIDVADDGIGIKPANVPHLFDSEVKTVDFGTAGEIGTGLGLPYCRDIMTAHGGSISLQTELGKGTSFRLTLPDSKPSILIVDDHAPTRFLLRSLLGELGVEVAEAADGIEALEKISTNQPQLIITDLNMPRMNGIDLLLKLKKSTDTRGIPVIAATKYDEYSQEGLDVRTRLLQLGADDFVNIPYSRNDLLARVKKLAGI
jgi:two-component system CheB/CheR fusion protein